MVFQLLKASAGFCEHQPQWGQAASHVPFRRSPETSKLCLTAVLDCRALWHPVDIAPTPAGAGEPSSVEMGDLRASPPWLIHHFPFLPQLCAVLSPSRAAVQPSHVSGSPTSSLVRAGYGAAPGHALCAPAVVEQPCLHPRAHSGLGFPHGPGQLQEQYKLLRLREK